MPATDIATSHALAKKLWEKKTHQEMLQESAFGFLKSLGVIYEPSEFNGQNIVGDELTYAYRAKLTGLPIKEGGTARGNEEALDIGSFTLKLGETRIPAIVKGKNTIDQQRTHLKFDEEARKAIKDRLVEFFDWSAFNQLGGFLGNQMTLDGTTFRSSDSTLLALTGENTCLAAGTDAIIRAGTATTDQGLGSSDKFTLSLVDKALSTAMKRRHALKLLSGGRLALFIHWDQYDDLKADTTSPITWKDIGIARMQAGNTNAVETLKKGNMYYAGSYQNVDIYVHNRIAYGYNSSTFAPITTVRRAVMVGRDALSIGSPWGMDTTTGVSARMSDEMIDYGHSVGICATTIYGMRKAQPSNGTDMGVITISTYAA
jgi:hypothetical protein